MVLKVHINMKENFLEKYKRGDEECQWKKGKRWFPSYAYLPLLVKYSKKLFSNSI